MTAAQQIVIAGAQQQALPFQRELYVDLFAGAGGASSGGARAYRDPDIAINHNPIAIAVHRANTNQIRLIGNSVCPDEAEDLIAANAKDLIDLYQREAA